MSVDWRKLQFHAPPSVFAGTKSKSQPDTRNIVTLYLRFGWTWNQHHPTHRFGKISHSNTPKHALFSCVHHKWPGWYCTPFAHTMVCLTSGHSVFCPWTDAVVKTLCVSQLELIGHLCCAALDGNKVKPGNNIYLERTAIVFSGAVLPRLACF